MTQNSILFRVIWQIRTRLQER